MLDRKASRLRSCFWSLQTAFDTFDSVAVKQHGCFIFGRLSNKYPEVSVTETQDSSQVKILLADDDLEILRITRTRLSKRGFTIIEAHDGEEALELAMAEHPHMVVLDVMMPKLNGWEVCKYLRARDSYNDVGVLMLTAIGPSLNELTSPLYGADEHLDKPFDLDELDAAVERILEKRRNVRLND